MALRYGAKVGKHTILHEGNHNDSFINIPLKWNAYCIDFSAGSKFCIETLDTTKRYPYFSNVPKTKNIITTAIIKVKCTVAQEISFPVEVIWQNATVPTFIAGKTYFVTLISYNNGTSWLGSYVGDWEE